MQAARQERLRGVFLIHYAMPQWNTYEDYAWAAPCRLRQKRRWVDQRLFFVADLRRGLFLRSNHPPVMHHLYRKMHNTA